MVVQEVRPQYYRLLSEAGLLEGCWKPGDLQPLVGYTFLVEAQLAFENYVIGTSGSISVGALVRGLTGEFKQGVQLISSVYCKASLLFMQGVLLNQSLQMQES